jgi:phosphoglycerate dehydrogenase-like enzyme
MRIAEGKKQSMDKAQTQGKSNELSVHLLYPHYDEERLSQLAAELPGGIHLTSGPDLPEPARFQVLVGGRLQREQIVASPNLHSLIVPWAGLPESTQQLMLEFPNISVHNLHYNALPVAEHTIALLLAASKFIVPMDRSLRAHDWRPRYEPSRSVLLQGKRALILGYGAIGRQVARLSRGLGLEVTAIRRRASQGSSATPADIAIAPPEALHRTLAQANLLIICLPHTPETTGLIGAAELALLQPPAVLVNIGRGSIVDQAALYQALRDGTLHAAGLDVWYNYPADEDSRAHTPPADYPFHQLDNVVMSPHRASGATEREELRITHLAVLLYAAARGEPMPNRVDLKAGY